MASFRLVTLAAAVALLASGCGILPSAGTGPDDAVKLFARGKGVPGMPAMPAMHGMKGQHGKPGMKGEMHGGGMLWPGVVLSAEQRAAMVELKKKHAPAPLDEAALKAEKEAHRAAADALDKALMAEPFDAAAFRAALTAAGEAKGEHKAPPTAFLVEARALLTDAQRAAAIAVLKAMPTPPEPPAGARPVMQDRVAERLGLDAAQKAKWAAVTDALKAARPAHKPDHAAQIAFLETGDAAALPQPPAKPALPVDAIVDFVSSLEGPQRGKLAAAGGLRFGFGGHGPKGMGRHGGPGKGGPGFPGGFGKKIAREG